MNWKDGDDVVIVPALKDEKELKERFPQGYKVVKPYHRLTPPHSQNKGAESKRLENGAYHG